MELNFVHHHACRCPSTYKCQTINRCSTDYEVKNTCFGFLWTFILTTIYFCVVDELFPMANKTSVIWGTWNGKRCWLYSSPPVLHICSESGQHWFRQWLVAYSVPGHYLNQCWVIVNWTIRNKIQWNFNQNIKYVIHENVSENIICEMGPILSRGRWVNVNIHSYQYEIFWCGSMVATRLLFLFSGNSPPDYVGSLYWIRAQVIRDHLASQYVDCPRLHELGRFTCGKGRCCQHR